MKTNEQLQADIETLTQIRNSIGDYDRYGNWFGHAVRGQLADAIGMMKQELRLRDYYVKQEADAVKLEREWRS